MLALEPVIKDEDGYNPAKSHELRVCAANLHELFEWYLPKCNGSFEAGTFTVGPKAKRSGSIRLLSSYFTVWGLSKSKKSSFVEIIELFWVFYIILFLVKPFFKISQNFPSSTGVV